MDLDSVSVQKHAKKELGQYQAILTSHLVNKNYTLISLSRRQLLAGDVVDSQPIKRKTKGIQLLDDAEQNTVICAGDIDKSGYFAITELNNGVIILSSSLKLVEFTSLSDSSGNFPEPSAIFHHNNVVTNTHEQNIICRQLYLQVT